MRRRSLLYPAGSESETPDQSHAPSTSRGHLRGRWRRKGAAWPTAGHPRERNWPRPASAPDGTSRPLAPPLVSASPDSFWPFQWHTVRPPKRSGRSTTETGRAQQPSIRDREHAGDRGSSAQSTTDGSVPGLTDGVLSHGGRYQSPARRRSHRIRDSPPWQWTFLTGANHLASCPRRPAERSPSDGDRDLERLGTRRRG